MHRFTWKNVNQNFIIVFPEKRSITIRVLCSNRTVHFHGLKNFRFATWRMLTRKNKAGVFHEIRRTGKKMLVVIGVRLERRNS